MNRNKAVDDRHSEWSTLDLDKLLEHLVVESEFMDVVDAVGEDPHEIWAFNWLAIDQLVKCYLNSLSEIKRVREIEAAILLECFQHVDKLTVLVIAASYGKRLDRNRATLTL